MLQESVIDECFARSQNGNDDHAEQRSLTRRAQSAARRFFTQNCFYTVSLKNYRQVLTKRVIMPFWKNELYAFFQKELAKGEAQ